MRSATPPDNGPLGLRAKGVRLGTVLSATAIAVEIGMELVSGIPNPAVLGIRCVMFVTAVTGFVLLSALRPRYHLWVCMGLCVVMTTALCALAAVSHSVTFLHMAVLAASPVISSALLPEERGLPVAFGALAIPGGGAVLYSLNGSAWEVARWSLLVFIITVFAYFGGLRYRRLQALLGEHLESQMQQLTQSLSSAAAELLRGRSEGEALQTVVDVLHGQGLNATILALQGAELVAVRMRLQIPDAAFPKRMEVGRFPGIDELMKSGRAVFHPDWHVVMGPLLAPEELAKWRAAAPRRSLTALISAEEAVFGLLSVQGDLLTPATGAAIELFARNLGGALENVRHHARAQERLAELARLQTELIARERLAVLGEAAAVVSHEVRNPLGAILNAVSLLRRIPDGTDRLPLLGMVEEEALRLDALVHDLLYLARPLVPEMRPLDLRELARSAVETVRQTPSCAHVIWELKVPAHPLSISADANHLQLAIGNLLRNAAQASPPAGVVRVLLEDKGDESSLAVEDQGPGIPPAQQDRIFDAFFTTREHGTGLGLAIVRRVAEAHGARIRVADSPSRGARFELGFQPLSRSPLEQAAPLRP